MVGIIGIITSLTVLGLSLVIIGLATVSLNLTGLFWETAKFQARSAFTGFLSYKYCFSPIVYFQ